VTSIPHLRIVVAFSHLAVVGYAAFSTYVVLVLKDAALTGDTIGTWKSFAVAGFFFWLGSSSGGKAKDTPMPRDAADAGRQVADAADDRAHLIEGATK
jgi:hypothetical protein